VESFIDPLYKELWYACAGPLVNVPREGERVYYFPQGHMEQVSCKFYSHDLFFAPMLHGLGNGVLDTGTDPSFGLVEALTLGQRDTVQIWTRI